MKPFTASTQSELESSRIALKDSIRRRNWLKEMKPVYCASLKAVENELEGRKLVTK